MRKHDTGSMIHAKKNKYNKNKINKIKKKSLSEYILLKLQNAKDKGKIIKATGKNDLQITGRVSRAMREARKLKQYFQSVDRK